ncbi:gamma-glutamyl-phosphate reductase [Lentzea guizhouensis]|uniref:Gamma-glutamyl phosphate reductase n=1 Tax=Lentzea guizhouensis TaxID=1586287 RepID=A0A1B2HMX7_9PSEU|nr:glutamate-5-semialdehyde dehydrogenase [Lentzea guizhouensis]ANZ39056.1 gamma-glutamyl-phosphate reductase [Lentzea guizhouensis]
MDVVTSAAQARVAAPPPGDPRYADYCSELAAGLTEDWTRVLAANAADCAESGLTGELLDRLTLAQRHLDVLLKLAEDVRAELPRVTGRVGNRIAKPLGVLLMIYEARPTVTIEGALLPVAVGNAVILRGGKEMAATNAELGRIAAEAAARAGLPDGIVQVVTDHDRRVVRELLKRHDVIDALIPRGSPSLIDYCLSASTIPVIASGGGVNHLYVDASADVPLAVAIALDSKLPEPTACNTLEMVLAHEDIAAELVEAFEAARDGWALKLDLDAHDYGREFLDRTIALHQVSSVDDAVAHIRRYGSGHTEGIVASDRAVVTRFLNTVDAAALVVNGSLRLHDGPTMALGPELSISTGRLHVRGPVGLSALLTYSWVIEGEGALRG